MNIGTIWAQLGLDTNPLKTGVADAQRHFNALEGQTHNLSKGLAIATLGYASLASAGAAAMYGLVQVVKTGIQAVDNFQISVIKTASLLSSLKGGEDIAGNFKEGIRYAQGLLPVLMEMDAQTVLNLENLQTINEELQLQGIIFKSNNKDQREGFLALANAVAVYSRMGADERQLRQEIRALGEGMVRTEDRLGQQAARILGGPLKGMVDNWKQQDTFLTHMKDLFAGYAYGAEYLANTWGAVSSSMKTAWTIVQLFFFAEPYKDLVKIVGTLNEYLKAHASEIATNLIPVYKDVKMVISGVAEAVAVLARNFMALYAVAKIELLVGGILMLIKVLNILIEQIHTLGIVGMLGTTIGSHPVLWFMALAGAAAFAGYKIGEMGKEYEKLLNKMSKPATATIPMGSYSKVTIQAAQYPVLNLKNEANESLTPLERVRKILDEIRGNLLKMPSLTQVLGLTMSWLAPINKLLPPALRREWIPQSERKTGLPSLPSHEQSSYVIPMQTDWERQQKLLQAGIQVQKALDDEALAQLKANNENRKAVLESRFTGEEAQIVTHYKNLAALEVSENEKEIKNLQRRNAELAEKAKLIIHTAPEGKGGPEYKAAIGEIAANNEKIRTLKIEETGIYSKYRIQRDLELVKARESALKIQAGMLADQAKYNRDLGELMLTPLEQKLGQIEAQYRAERTRFNITATFNFKGYDEAKTNADKTSALLQGLKASADEMEKSGLDLATMLGALQELGKLTPQQRAAIQSAAGGTASTIGKIIKELTNQAKVESEGAFSDMVSSYLSASGKMEAAAREQVRKAEASKAYWDLVEAAMKKQPGAEAAFWATENEHQLMVAKGQLQDISTAASIASEKITLALNQVDQAENEFAITTVEASQRRIALLNQQIALKQAQLAILHKLPQIPEVITAEDQLLKDITDENSALIQQKNIIRDLADDGWRGLIDGVAAYAKEVGGLYKVMYDGAKETAQNMQKTFSDVFFDTMEGEIKHFSDYFTSFLKTLERTIADMVSKELVASMFKDVNVGNKGGLMGGLFGGLFGMVKDLFKGNANAALDMTPPTTSVYGDMLASFTASKGTEASKVAAESAFTKSLGDFTTWCGNIFSDMGNWITDSFTSLGTWLTNTFSSVGTWFTNTFSTIGSWLMDVFSNIGSWLMDVLSSSGGGGGGLFGWFGDLFGGGGGDLEIPWGDVSGTFATGGYAQAGKIYLVGEKGPELFIPNTSGSVVPGINQPDLSGSTNTPDVEVQINITPPAGTQVKPPKISTRMDGKKMIKDVMLELLYTDPELRGAVGR